MLRSWHYLLYLTSKCIHNIVVNSTYCLSVSYLFFWIKVELYIYLYITISSTKSAPVRWILPRMIDYACSNRAMNKCIFIQCIWIHSVPTKLKRMINNEAYAISNNLNIYIFLLLAKFFGFGKAIIKKLQIYMKKDNFNSTP